MSSVNIFDPAKTRAKADVLEVHEIEPIAVRRTETGGWFMDFGRAAFGTLRLTVTSDRSATTTVRLGEKLADDGRIDRHPPGTVRYREILLELESGTRTMLVVIPPDERNTGPGAVRMPDSLFEVMPFRYAEVEINAAVATLDRLCQLAVLHPFDDEAAAFTCDDDRLNRVWELCKYSIKATSFCGIYVDGDRERIPYEADAYINQLCHYGVDAEYEMARRTFEHLLSHPTWPTEWVLHFVPMAWADYQYTGRKDLLKTCYPQLQRKALLALAREDGLISTETGRVTPELLRELRMDALKNPLRDLVDWPPGSFTDGGTGERDNYDMVPVKTVVNAFHAWNLDLLGQIADLLGKAEDAAAYRERHARVAASLRQVCFDERRGVFVDGEGSAHASLHANMIPAALGLVPRGREESVLAFITSRGMACSVYGAQYLLESCYRLGDPGHALKLMTAEHDRGWLNMLRVGSTVTLEAWDHKYKNNLDWNHAWGAAPANILPRFVAGVSPASPGFAEILIAPQPAGLKRMDAKVPTPRGPVTVQIESVRNGERLLRLQTPAPARLQLDGLLPPGTNRNAERMAFHPLPAGRHEFTIDNRKGRIK